MKISYREEKNSKGCSHPSQNDFLTVNVIFVGLNIGENNGNIGKNSSVFEIRLEKSLYSSRSVKKIHFC